MTRLSKSYLSVPYDLRPAKQVERRMFIDAFGLLSDAGFPIRGYKYTGMGSIHFIDFILLHRYLGLTNFLSVESSHEIEKRIEFNKPFACVDTKIGPIGNEIASLSQNTRHILWLDYDSVITADLLRDVVAATAHLSVGSIILVTIDAEPPGPPEHRAKEWRDYFVEEAEDYLPQPNSVTDFGREKLTRLCMDILGKALSRGRSGDTNVSLFPLFNFQYADGHTMISMGGMIAGSNERTMIESSGLVKANFYRPKFDIDPFIINVPVVTRKERIYLDSQMPCGDGWLPSDFELSHEKVLAYRSVYRFLPSYAELLL